jgi:hypothetical protein
MNSQKINAHKITKPIQLMAVWFIALFLIDSALLAAACQLSDPAWIRPTLIVSAIIFVPLFLLAIFLMQTVFRKELQDDEHYAEWLERQEKTFGSFQPENFQPISSLISNKSVAFTQAKSDLEGIRVAKYENQQGLFLVHAWRPSFSPGQVADIVIWLHQHGNGPLSKGEVEKVEYELGRKFFPAPKVKYNVKELFKLDVSAYGPMLCIARVFVRGQDKPIILERYINFEEEPS